MSVAAGVGGIILCFLFIEAISLLLARLLRKKGWSYELQHLPLFLMQLGALYSFHKAILFPPALQVLVQFGLLYSGIGAGSLVFLGLVRHLHYQSYIFIVNWLRRS
ncbi:MAG: hypothetical protein ACE3JR_11970 [Ectobacillus sp.]